MEREKGGSHKKRDIEIEREKEKKRDSEKDN